MCHPNFVCNRGSPSDGEKCDLSAWLPEICGPPSRCACNGFISVFGYLAVWHVHNCCRLQCTGMVGVGPSGAALGGAAQLANIIEHCVEHSYVYAFGWPLCREMEHVTILVRRNVRKCI